MLRHTFAIVWRLKEHTVENMTIVQRGRLLCACNVHSSCMSTLKNNRSTRFQNKKMKLTERENLINLYVCLITHIINN